MLPDVFPRPDINTESLGRWAPSVPAFSVWKCNKSNETSKDDVFEKRNQTLAQAALRAIRWFGGSALRLLLVIWGVACELLTELRGSLKSSFKNG